MNKADLRDFVAEDAGITKKEASTVIDAVLGGITKGVVEDGKVSLVGFGSFSAVERKARTARNPQTGEAIEVPARMVPKFKASSKLKEAVETIGV